MRRPHVLHVGMGVFARHTISKGTCIVEYEGEVINPEQHRLRLADYTARGVDDYTFEIEG